MDTQSRQRIQDEIRERGERREALIERINILIGYGLIDAPSFSTHTECYTELDMIGMLYDAAINAMFKPAPQPLSPPKELLTNPDTVVTFEGVELKNGDTLQLPPVRPIEGE